MNKSSLLRLACSFLVLLGAASAGASAKKPIKNDPRISKNERGIVCRAIDTKYPGLLKSVGQLPGWIACREGHANFMRWAPENDPGYTVVEVNIRSEKPIRCTSRIQATEAKTHSAVVACWP